MTNSNFQNTLNNKTDEELISIVQTRNGFSEEFLNEAEQILIKRGYEINSVEEHSKNEEAKNALDEKEYYLYWPILLSAVLLIALQFKNHMLYAYHGERNLFYLFSVYETIILSAIFHLAQKFGFRKWLWALPSLVLLPTVVAIHNFSYITWVAINMLPFSLVCLNIAIWLTPVPKKSGGKILEK